jgi:hypothetical protein
MDDIVTKPQELGERILHLLGADHRRAPVVRAPYLHQEFSVPATTLRLPLKVLGDPLKEVLDRRVELM